MTRHQVKLLRLYHGQTQSEFAKVVGVATTTIAKIEANLSPISATTKAKILRNYDLLDEGYLTFCQRMKELDL